MEKIITVRCSLANGSMDQTMSVGSVEEFLAKVDTLVDGMRMESPRGPGTITLIRSGESFFPMNISEDALPSKTILYWERHALEVLFAAEQTSVLDESDYGGIPDAVSEPKEPWQ